MTDIPYSRLALKDAQTKTQKPLITTLEILAEPHWQTGQEKKAQSGKPVYKQTKEGGKSDLFSPSLGYNLHLKLITQL